MANKPRVLLRVLSSGVRAPARVSCIEVSCLDKSKTESRESPRVAESRECRAASREGVDSRESLDGVESRELRVEREL